MVKEIVIPHNTERANNSTEKEGKARKWTLIVEECGDCIFQQVICNKGSKAKKQRSLEIAT